MMNKHFKLIVLSLLVILTCASCGLSRKPVKEVFSLQDYSEAFYADQVNDIEKLLLKIQDEQANGSPASDELIAQTNQYIASLISNAIYGRIYVEHHKTHLNILNLVQSELGKSGKPASQLNWPNDLNLSDDIKKSLKKLDMLDNWVMNIVDSYRDDNFATDNHQLDFKQYFDSLNADVQNYYISTHYATFKHINCTQALISTMNEQCRKGQVGLTIQLPAACENIEKSYDPENIYTSDAIVRFEVEKTRHEFEDELSSIIKDFNANHEKSSRSISSLNNLIKEIEMTAGGPKYIQAFTPLFEKLNANGNPVVIYGTLTPESQTERMQSNAQKRIDDFDRTMINYFEQSLRAESEKSLELRSAKLKAFENAYYNLLLSPAGLYHYFEPKRMEVITDIARLNAFESLESFFPWDEEYLNQKAAIKDSEGAYPAHQLKIEVEKRKYHSLIKRFSKVAASDELLADSLLLPVRLSLHELSQLPGGNAFINKENIELLNRKLCTRAAKIIYKRSEDNDAITAQTKQQVETLGRNLDRYIRMFYMKFSPHDSVGHQSVLKLYSNMLSLPGGLEAIFERKTAVEYLNELAYLWLAYMESAISGDTESVTILTSSFLKKYPEMNGIPDLELKNTTADAKKQSALLSSYLHSSTDFTKVSADEFNETWQKTVDTLVIFDYMIRNEAQLLSELVEKGSIVTRNTTAKSNVQNPNGNAVPNAQPHSSNKADILNKIATASLEETPNVCDDFSAQYKDLYETIRYYDEKTEMHKQAIEFHENLSEKYSKAGDSRNAASELQKSKHETTLESISSRDLEATMKKLPKLQEEAKKNHCTLEEI